MSDVTKLIEEARSCTSPLVHRLADALEREASEREVCRIERQQQWTARQEAEKDLADRQLTVETLQRQVSELTKERDHSDAALATIREMDDAADAPDEDDGMVAKLAHRLRQVEKERDEARIAAHEAGVALRRERDQLRARVTELVEDRTSHRMVVLQANQRADDFRAQMEELTRERDKAIRRGDAIADDLGVRILEVAEERDQLRAQVAAMRATLEEIAGRYCSGAEMRNVHDWLTERVDAALAHAAGRGWVGPDVVGKILDLACVLEEEPEKYTGGHGGPADIGRRILALLPAPEGPGRLSPEDAVSRLLSIARSPEPRKGEPK